MLMDRRGLMVRLTAFGALLAAAAPARAASTARVHVPSARTAFEPAEITIKVGDSVEWENRSIVPHTVTCDPAKAKDKTHAAFPAGAKPFGSAELAQDDTFTQTFTVAGTYRYFCIEHEDMGMLGTVIVKG